MFQTKMVYPADFPAGSRKGMCQSQRTVAVALLTPPSTEVSDPFSTYGMPYDDLTLTTPDNVKIRAYLICARNRSDIESLKRSHDARRKKAEEKGDTDATQPLTEEQAQFAKSRPTILLYHANAGNMGHRIPLAHIFWNNMGCNVMMLSYRGYGLSEGSPSEKGMRMDAQVSVRFVSSCAAVLKPPPYEIR